MKIAVICLYEEHFKKFIEDINNDKDSNDKDSNGKSHIDKYHYIKVLNEQDICGHEFDDITYASYVNLKSSYKDVVKLRKLEELCKYRLKIK